MNPPESQLDKQELRRWIRGRRAHQYGATPAGAAARAAAADGLADIGRGLVAATVTPGGTVTSYRSWRAEPPTTALNEALRAAGFTVLVPVTLPDRTLDWYADTGAAAVGDLGPWGETVDPASPALLGAAAFAGADMALIPGLAVDPHGHRLGQGGGYYDRALADLDPATKVVVVLYDEDLVDQVPVEGHDRRVDGVLTPTGVRWFWQEPTNR